MSTSKQKIDEQKIDIKVEEIPIEIEIEIEIDIKPEEKPVDIKPIDIKPEEKILNKNERRKQKNDNDDEIIVKSICNIITIINETKEFVKLI